MEFNKAERAWLKTYKPEYNPPTLTRRGYDQWRAGLLPLPKWLRDLALAAGGSNV